MKANKLILSAMLLLAMIAAGCSSDDDGDDGDTKTLVQESKIDAQFRNFMETELPFDNLLINKKRTFFNDIPETENNFFLVGSRNELMRLHDGTKDVPDFDLSGKTMIVGFYSLPAHADYIEKKELHKNADGYVLYLYLHRMPEDKGTYPYVQKIYYWGVYPKFENLPLTVEIIYNDK